MADKQLDLKQSLWNSLAKSLNVQPEELLK